MSININHNEYIFEDEELEEIEYLEIMSIDDIIKDNPSFIANGIIDIANRVEPSVETIFIQVKPSVAR